MPKAPLNSLQGFVAAARSGNISRAAESLNLTVSALSHQIRQLEKRLGYELLSRGARGVRPTAEGINLLEQLGPHLDAVLGVFQPHMRRSPSTLVLNIFPSMANPWLVPRLGSFILAHPEIQLAFYSSEQLVDFGKQPQFVCSIGTGEGNWPGVIAERFLGEWLVPMASPELIARMGGLDARPLNEWPLFGHPDGQWQRWFDETGSKSPSNYVAILDADSHHLAALSGAGVALGWLTRSMHLLASGKLVALSDRRLQTSLAHWLLYPESSFSHPGFQIFREWLKDEGSKTEKSA